jgi:hypothetical protein
MFIFNSILGWQGRIVAWEACLCLELGKGCTQCLVLCIALSWIGVTVWLSEALTAGWNFLHKHMYIYERKDVDMIEYACSGPSTNTLLRRKMSTGLQRPQ